MRPVLLIFAMLFFAQCVVAADDLATLFKDAVSVSPSKRDPSSEGLHEYYRAAPFRPLSSDDRALLASIEKAQKVGGILLEGIAINLVFKRRSGGYFLVERTAGGEHFGIFKMRKAGRLFEVPLADADVLIGYYYLPKGQ